MCKAKLIIVMPAATLMLTLSELIYAAHLALGRSERHSVACKQ